MASFAPIKGTRTDIGNTPIVEGQFLVETDQNADNRIYLDIGTGTGNRVIVGGNANYIDLTSDVISGTGAAVTVTFQNVVFTTSNAIQIFSEEYTDGTGNTPVSGDTNNLVPLNYSGIRVDDSTTPYTIKIIFPSVPSGKYYKVTLRVSV